jgi:hypothetical protein
MHRTKKSNTDDYYYNDETSIILNSLGLILSIVQANQLFSGS